VCRAVCLLFGGCVVFLCLLSVCVLIVVCDSVFFLCFLCIVWFDFVCAVVCVSFLCVWCGV